MKITRLALSTMGFALAALAAVFAQSPAPNTLPAPVAPVAPVAAPDNAALLQFVTMRARLTRVTVKLEKMDRTVAINCGIDLGTPYNPSSNPSSKPPPPPPDHRQLVPGPNAMFQVYVTPGGVAAFKDNKPPFPVGTVLLKEKFSSPDAQTPELFTGMIKREKGFNPACGDWEFFTANGAGTAITARGRIESCIACHQNYASFDFVTRNYPTVFDPPALKPPGT